MSVTRRQFLLSTAGAAVGAIIPSFYQRALEFLERFEKPLLIPPERITEDLLVVDLNGYPELCLGDPYEGPPQMSYREFFTRYQPEAFDNLEEDWGLEPSDLDQLIDSDDVWDEWLRCDSPSARAYHTLWSLDLGRQLKGPDAVGGLDFMEESNMVSTWLAVSPRNEVTLSLLQQRLNDLGTGIRVVTDYAR